MMWQDGAMTEAPGRRERKKLERRRRIEAAAIDLFEAAGYEGTTIDEIAASADIAPRTFFYYFTTKEDVVLADYSERLDTIVEVLARRPLAESPWTALRAAFTIVAADYTSRRDELIRRFAIMAESPAVHARSLQLQAGWEEAIAEILTDRAGTGADDVLPRLMASAALACMRSALQHWMLTDHRAELPALLQECFDRLANGLDEP